jgi:indole-3-glycerol phosphate synthase
MSSDFLERVIAEKKREVEDRRKATPERVLRDQALRRSQPRQFAKPVKDGKNISVIAEMKKASPSAGKLREHYDVPQIAHGYASGGAAAFSVLTDEKYFQGTLEHLDLASSLNLRPILRKDFVVDSYQILEARAHGADAILLIVAALRPDELVRLQGAAEELSMDALVEIHNEGELEVALNAGSRLIGINNRDLKNLRTSLETTERLAPLVPGDRIIVSESGITSKADVERLARCGIHAILVGTHLMRQPDPRHALAELVGVQRR